MSLVLQDQLVLSPATADHLQEEIDAIEAGSDVTDVVGTYEDLENYDTSALTDKDVIKVLDDETRNHAQTYYRWSTSAREFSYVGQIAKPAVDSVNGKTGDVVLNKSDVGLGNVDNTSDANKPVSTAQQTALNEKVSKTATASQVYGTDANGAQTTYNKDDFGQVDDVQVNGTSVVTNKIASIPNEIEWAEYNVTTYQQAKAWYDAGKIVALKRNSRVYFLQKILENQSYKYMRFVSSDQEFPANLSSYILWGLQGGQAPSGTGWGLYEEKTELQSRLSGTAGNVVTYTNIAGTMGSVALAAVATTGDYSDLINVPDPLPSQTGQAGKILGTDGTNAAWETKTTVSFRTWGANE